MVLIRLFVSLPFLSYNCTHSFVKSATADIQSCSDVNVQRMDMFEIEMDYIYLVTFFSLDTFQYHFKLFLGSKNK